MNIRSIIGLTALTPYIIGATLLATSACAPKSRYRGPVNVTGTGPILSPEEKAAVQDQTDARMKEIAAEQAANPEKKEAQTNLDKQILDLDVDLDLVGSNAIITISTKDDKGEPTATSFEGKIIEGQKSDLTVTEDGKSDIQVSTKCFDGVECKAVTVIVKKGNAELEYRVSSGLPAAAVEIAPRAEGAPALSEEEQVLASKLLQIKTSKATEMLNMTLNKGTLTVEIKEELADKSVLELAVKGSSAVSREAVLAIIPGAGLEKITLAQLTKRVGDISSVESMTDIQLSTGGENALVATLKLGKEAGEIQQKRTEDQLKKDEEAKKLADAEAAKKAEAAGTPGTDTFVGPPAPAKLEPISNMNFEDGAEVLDMAKVAKPAISNKDASISTLDDDDVYGGSASPKFK